MSQPEYPDRDPDLLFQLARDRLNNQLAAVDAIDSKTGLLFGLSSGLLGIVAAVVALRAAVSDETPSGWLWLALVLVAVAYGVVAYKGVNAYLVRSWNVGSELKQVWDDLWKLTDRNAKWRATRQVWADYDTNRAGYLKKRHALDYMLAGVILQSLLVVLALVLAAAGV